MLLEIVRGKEAEFFTGVGSEKKIKPGKESEWMQFQQRVFNLETDVSERIKNVKDVKNMDQIVSDVLGADYVKVKKQQRYMPPTESGFGPMNPSQIEEGSGVILPMPTWNMQDTQF